MYKNIIRALLLSSSISSCLFAAGDDGYHQNNKRKRNNDYNAEGKKNISLECGIKNIIQSHHFTFSEFKDDRKEFFRLAEKMFLDADTQKDIKNALFSISCDRDVELNDKIEVLKILWNNQISSINPYILYKPHFLKNYINALKNIDIKENILHKIIDDNFIEKNEHDKIALYTLKILGVHFTKEAFYKIYNNMNSIPFDMLNCAFETFLAIKNPSWSWQESHIILNQLLHQYGSIGFYDKKRIKYYETLQILFKKLSLKEYSTYDFLKIWNSFNFTTSDVKKTIHFFKKTNIDLNFKNLNDYLVLINLIEDDTNLSKKKRRWFYTLSNINFSELEQNFLIHNYNDVANDFDFIVNGIIQINDNSGLFFIKENLLHFVESALTSDNEKLAFSVASWILEDNDDEPFFDEEHPLSQLALRIMLLLNENQDPKNPYKIHRNLLKKRNQEVNFDSLLKWRFLKYNNFDYKISMNPFFFKKLSEMKVDLNSVPEIDSNILDKLLNDLEKRVAISEKLSKEIKEITQENFNNIVFKTISNYSETNARYLPNLLKKPSSHIIGAQWKCVIKNILNMNNQASDADSLSEQEKYLLLTLTSINHCSIGQDGGVSETYSQLPYQAKLKTENGDYYDFALFQKKYGFFCSILQNLVEGMFSGTNDLMKEICCTEDVEQAVHQGLYLRNLIGDLVGSAYKIKFDINAGIYYENLLALSRQNALDIFYKHANNNLASFIHYVTIKINETIGKKEGLPIYNQLVEILKDQISKGIFELDEDDQPKLTQEGVVLLLVKMEALLQDTRLFS